MATSIVDADSEVPDKLTSAKLCTILLIILLSLTGLFHAGGAYGGGSAATDISGTGAAGPLDPPTEIGYIINISSAESGKVLVYRRQNRDGCRTLWKRVGLMDGEHFVEEEETLAQRPDLMADLLDGKSITFWPGDSENTPNLFDIETEGKSYGWEWVEKGLYPTSYLSSSLNLTDRTAGNLANGAKLKIPHPHGSRAASLSGIF